MGPHLIAILKAEETLFSLLIQIQKYLIFLVNVVHKLSDMFFMKFSNCSRLPDVPNMCPEWTFWVVNWRFVCHQPIPAPSINTFLHLCHWRTLMKTMLVPTTRAKSIVGICRMTFYISVEKLEALLTTTNNLWLSDELVWGSDNGPGDLGFNPVAEIIFPVKEIATHSV